MEHHLGIGLQRWHTESVGNSPAAVRLMPLGSFSAIAQPRSSIGLKNLEDGNGGIARRWFNLQLAHQKFIESNHGAIPRDSCKIQG